MESGDETPRIHQSVLGPGRFNQKETYSQPSLRKRMGWPQILSRWCREKKNFYHGWKSNLGYPVAQSVSWSLHWLITVPYIKT